MQVWDGCLAPQLVNKLGLPEQHNVLCILDSLLNFGGQEVSGLSFLYFVQFAKRTSSEFFDNFVPLVKNFLTFFHLDV
jgi:hypothetical protein